MAEEGSPALTVGAGTLAAGQTPHGPGLVVRRGSSELGLSHAGQLGRGWAAVTGALVPLGLMSALVLVLTGAAMKAALQPPGLLQDQRASPLSGWTSRWTSHSELGGLGSELSSGEGRLSGTARSAFALDSKARLPWERGPGGRV